MRITGGKWRSRILAVPKSEVVRPTQDRVREALFSILMHVVPDSSVLDLFAGSGAFGIDALSHGASQAYFVEQDKKCFATLSKNLTVFGIDSVLNARQADVFSWLERGTQGMRFDLVFADPPYLFARNEGFSRISELLKNVLSPQGFFVAEMDSRTDAEVLDGYEQLSVRDYGHTRIAIYRLLPAE